MTMCSGANAQKSDENPSTSPPCELQELPLGNLRFLVNMAEKMAGAESLLRPLQLTTYETQIILH